ncbi:MAG: M20/M25/M40 family metallo-hydrolase [Candidatus Brocadiae bacterium]|nr:M20/M25/M40 family metallo-hydrolase [Candidatus Brocadiia bacterium]
MRRIAWLPVLPLVAILIALGTSRNPAPAAAGDLRFDGARAFGDLEALVAQFGPRPTHPERSRVVAAWIADRWKAEGFQARVSTGLADGRRVSNAIAMLPGATDRFLVVLGHHDSVMAGPGAEDNASAVAALFEIARALRDRPLRHTIVLAATDAEETGGQGADLLIADLGRDRILRTDACVGLEMLAWPGGAPVLHALPRNYALDVAGVSTPGTVPAVIARAAPEHVPLGDPAIPLLAQSLTRGARVRTGSDDVYFLREGVPSLFLSRSSLSRFYPHYHKPTDTPDRLSPAALHSSGRILESALLALDARDDWRDGPTDYLLWHSSLLTQRHLAGISISAALPLAVLALVFRPRCRRLAFGAALAALPLISCSLRFQPLALFVALPHAALWPLIASTRPRWARFALSTLATLPTVLALALGTAGTLGFGLELPQVAAISSLLAAAFASAGTLCAARGLPGTVSAAPAEPRG